MLWSKILEWQESIVLVFYPQNTAMVQTEFLLDEGLLLFYICTKRYC